MDLECFAVSAAHCPVFAVTTRRSRLVDTERSGQSIAPAEHQVVNGMIYHGSVPRLRPVLVLLKVPRHGMLLSEKWFKWHGLTVSQKNVASQCITYCISTIFDLWMWFTLRQSNMASWKILRWWFSQPETTSSFGISQLAMFASSARFVVLDPKSKGEGDHAILSWNSSRCFGCWLVLEPPCK